MFFSVKEQNIFDAHELYLDGKYDKALRLCEQLLAVNPDSYSALNILANIYFINNDYDKGELYIYKLKDYFVKKNEYDKAIAFMKRLVAMRPEKIKHYKDIGDLYLTKGDKRSYFNSYIAAAEIYRHSGHFKNSADIYLEIAENVIDTKYLLTIINKMVVINAIDQVGELASKYIFDSEAFTDEEKDDITLLCAESGCKVDYYIHTAPAFLSRGSGRIAFIEDALVNYFSAKQDDDLFYKVTSTEADVSSFLERLKEIAPENMPHITKDEVEHVLEEEGIVEEVVDEELPEEAAPNVEAMEIVTDKVEQSEEIELEQVELDSHIESVDTDVHIEQIELDSYDVPDAKPILNTDISGLEKFDAVDDTAEVPVLDGLETYDFYVAPAPTESPEMEETEIDEPEAVLDNFDDTEVVYPKEEGLDLFDEKTQESDSDDIFSNFDSGEEVKADDDIFSSFEKPEPSENKDIFENEYENEEVTEKEVEQIDMSDVNLENIEKEDMFAGLVDEEKEEEKKPETVKIDMSDIKTDVKKETDIFDQEV